MQQIEFEVIGNTARHIAGEAVLVEGGGLSVSFRSLPSGKEVFEAGIGKVCEAYPINDGEARITRNELKTGILQGKVQIGDSCGQKTKEIVCESIHVSSVNTQERETRRGDRSY